MDNYRPAKNAPSFKPSALYKRNSLHSQTIVFDLDETLIKASEDPKNIRGKIDKQLKFNDMNDEERLINLSIRPYTVPMLSQLMKKFELIAFTAGQKNYAELIVSSINQRGKEKGLLPYDG